MRIVSLNVSRPRLVMRHGQSVSTGIYKVPVEGRVKLRTLNLDGDRQADLTVHGGPTKAVYVYAAARLDEASVNTGDRFRIVAAVVMFTEPRMPCYKPGIKFGRTDILKRFTVTPVRVA
jgi:MOSC domain-containing protein YiiM